MKRVMRKVLGLAVVAGCLALLLFVGSDAKTPATPYPASLTQAATPYGGSLSDLAATPAYAFCQKKHCVIQFPSGNLVCVSTTQNYHCTNDDPEGPCTDAPCS